MIWKKETLRSPEQKRLMIRVRKRAALLPAVAGIGAAIAPIYALALAEHQMTSLAITLVLTGAFLGFIALSYQQPFRFRIARQAAINRRRKAWAEKLARYG
jgi:VIT1/CCC1 family predicted Fe2+/Mn2+ transporter